MHYVSWIESFSGKFFKDIHAIIAPLPSIALAMSIYIEERGSVKLKDMKYFLRCGYYDFMLTLLKKTLPCLLYNSLKKNDLYEFMLVVHAGTSGTANRRR